MKRLSEQYITQRDTHQYRFSLDYDINQQVVSGEWRQIYDDPTYNIAELTMLIADFYNLDQDIEDTLCFRYENYIGQQKRWITLLEQETLENKIITSEQGDQRPLTIEDVHISCFIPRGAIVEREVTCDSAFMLQHLPHVGADLRRKMPWVPPRQPIYLIMDNAGGHGTRDAIDQYTQQLQRDYNITIIFQLARSPDVNALDVGIWMSVQSSVERKHRNRRRDPDALAETVQEAWDNLPMETIASVFERLPINLQLIVDREGDNDGVEGRRGRRHRRQQHEE